MKNYLYGALCGAIVFFVLSWAVPRKIAKAAVLSAPPEGRFQLVQLHPNANTEWSAVLDTETGCSWVYESQTPPTDAEVDAAAAGEPRAYKSYEQSLGNNFFSIVGYDDNGPTMTLAGQARPSTVAGGLFSTLATEEYYCNEARQSAIRAAAAH